MKRLSLIVFVILSGLCLAHGTYFYPQLPEAVDSRFALSGDPAAAMSKTVFLVLYYVLVLGIGGMILGFAFLLGKISPASIKLPHKAHWMSRENERETRAFLGSHLYWLGSATMVLFLDVFHQSFRVSLGAVDKLTHFNLSLGLYLAFTALWVVGLFVRFSRPPKVRAT